MLGELGRLGRETLVYGLSTVAGRLLTFLLVPFYTHLLSPAENGIVGAAYAYIAFLNVVYQHGMDQAYLRRASSGGGGFPAAMGSLLAASLVLSAALFLGAEPLAAALGLPGELSDLPRLWAGILALDALACVPFAELRRSHRAWTYAGVRLANIAVQVWLNVLFLWKFEWGVRGVFLANLLASTASALLLLPPAVRAWRRAGAGGTWGELLRFGLPFVPAGLASMVVQVADRPILKALTDDSTVGIYHANYKLGIFMMLAVGMFDQAWRPFFFEREGRPDAPRLFGRVLTYFLLAGSLLLLALSLFVGELVRLPVLGRPLIHPAFWPGLKVVPVVLAAYLLNGAYVNFVAQAALADRTSLLAWAAGLGAAVNVGANLLLIPPFGMLGAAWATFLAYGAMAASLFLMARRHYPVPYEWERLSRMLFAFTAVCAALWAGRTALGPEGSPGGWACLRVAALFAYPALLWACGFLIEEERLALRRLAARFLR